MIAQMLEPPAIQTDPPAIAIVVSIAGLALIAYMLYTRWRRGR